MENTIPLFVDGTAALSPSQQFETELDKDRWDARTIPGLRYAPHRGDYYIDFLGIPGVFRSLVKEYVTFLLAADRTAKTLIDTICRMESFFAFFLKRYPGVDTFHDLTQQDVDMFILECKATSSQRQLKHGQEYIWRRVYQLEDFLNYLERIGSPVRPSEPVTRVIWPHHYPKRESLQTTQVKYIPQTVLSQLEAYIPHLPPDTIPIAIILRASGWRISDVLYLKTHTCLVQEEGKWSLTGDIQKTKILGHKIPITQEVAAVILAQVAWVKQQYTEQENPQKWLFPASKSGKWRTCNSPRFQQGNPRHGSTMNQALNRLAKRYQIKDEQGNIFHFKSHAFRHTKAVELINNGMSLIMVQQWMAHASPEMTLIYAKILDETMRTQWEKTVQQGIVQFNDGKPEFVPGKKLLPMAGTNAFDPERVREHRQNVKMALGSCLKTTKIICKFVELPCFHCPAYVLTPDDLPALEAYKLQILERIEVGKQAGNTHWIEVNQKNLDERVQPALALLKQGHMVAKTDKQEREYTDEEWEQRQHHLLGEIYE